jgi:hypothetical protein
MHFLIHLPVGRLNNYENQSIEMPVEMPHEAFDLDSEVDSAGSKATESNNTPRSGRMN